MFTSLFRKDFGGHHTPTSSVKAGVTVRPCTHGLYKANCCLFQLHVLKVCVSTNGSNQQGGREKKAQLMYNLSTKPVIGLVHHKKVYKRCKEMHRACMVSYMAHRALVFLRLWRDGLNKNQPCRRRKPVTVPQLRLDVCV